MSPKFRGRAPALVNVSVCKLRTKLFRLLLLFDAHFVFLAVILFRRFSRPYDNAYMISAQVLSIVACLASWLWWPTMVISLVAMIAHQIVWCCRCLKVERIRCITGISVLATLLCISAGIYELVALHKATWCGLFYFSDAEFGTMKFYKDGEAYFDNSSSEPDECPERVLAALSFVTGRA